ncbi:hypothetical protein [Aquabacterium sp. OR-4]|uniref:hypothetical protein n=1 Tax=Aquabacterium sp. OR-4 TaxID=2978127 RepID=UPI0021B2891C|nr:hypothetical protein [Aquabacterium sp. OR-4]MDT7833865.1 hypothetical protein [Aquabacterium sp. OR-4]
MTVRSTLLTAATAAVALLGAATCQAATTTDWYPAGEGEVIQHSQPLRSTLSRAQVVAQVEAAQRQHTLAAPGELVNLPAATTGTPTLARADVKRDTVAAVRAGQLLSAGEALAVNRPAAPRAAAAAKTTAAGQ